MGNKENVLEILRKHKDGLTFAELNIEYKTEYGKELGHNGHDLYNYLDRLDDKGLVETFIPKTRVGKVVSYRATEKAFEPEKQKKALEKLKELKAFMENKMDITKTINDDDIKLLEEIEELV